jgi:glycosyltransferase involved in cell wall biosynthesis
MRIVVLLGPDLKAVSGVSTHLNQLLKSKLGDRFDLHHFQIGSEGKSESTVEKIFRFAWSPFQLMALLRRCHPAVVHINTSMNPRGFWRDLAYLLVSRSVGCKVVYQVHGGALPLDFAGGNVLFQRLMRAAFRLADIIVLLGEFQRKAYQAFSPDLRLQVVPNAIDVRDLLVPVQKTEPGHPLKLVFFGRLAAEKGIFEMVEAVSLLRNQGIDMSLAIAGSGPEEHRLRQRIADLGIGQSVTLKGAVFGADKNKLWLESDVFVFPTYREGLPYALLESMAACTVPVTCRVGAIPDVLEEQKHGLFVQPKDPDGLASALRWLHENREALPRLGTAARERVLAEYTLTRLSDHFIKIYEQL